MVDEATLASGNGNTRRFTLQALRQVLALSGLRMGGQPGVERAGSGPQNKAGPRPSLGKSVHDLT